MLPRFSENVIVPSSLVSMMKSGVIWKPIFNILELSGTDMEIIVVNADGAEKFVHFANSIIKYGILGAKVIQIEDY